MTQISKIVTGKDLRSACEEGKEWFRSAFPEGAKLGILLRQLVNEDRIAWAGWVILNLEAFRTVYHDDYVDYRNKQDAITLALIAGIVKE